MVHVWFVFVAEGDCFLDLFWYVQEHCQADSTICGKKWTSVSDESHEQRAGKCSETLL